MATSLTTDIRPQPKQEIFLAHEASFAIFGGSAYVGKTWALLLEPLYHVHNPAFGAVFFRRTFPRITQEGGMWDESQKLYRPLGAEPNKTEHLWTFPSGAAVSFSHLQHEGDEIAYYGAQICLLCFDQLEEFSANQVFYMLGRNRSTCGITPYCRATCNPDPDSWLAKFLAWWIDEDTGNPIPERSGVIRWCIRLPDDSFAWANQPSELYATYGPGVFPKSVTFIPGTLDDNPIGRQLDPSYEANLMLQVGYLRQRLRYGNWKVRPSAGNFFKAHWFDLVDTLPAGCRKVRFWDLAASEPTVQNPDPDYTVGTLEAMEPSGYFYVVDVTRDRVSPGSVEKMILHTAEQDGHEVEIGIEQEPGASGKITAFDLGKKLAMRGFLVKLYPKRIKTELAAAPLASAAELGSVRLVRGRWNTDFLSELVNFHEAKHDDIVVSCTGAHGVLTKTLKGDRVGGQWAPVGT